MCKALLFEERYCFYLALALLVGFVFPAGKGLPDQSDPSLPNHPAYEPQDP